MVHVHWKLRKDNISGSEELWPHQMPLCRLCGEEIYDDKPIYIHETVEDGKTLADKINTCLPVVVSRFSCVLLLHITRLTHANLELFTWEKYVPLTHL